MFNLSKLRSNDLAGWCTSATWSLGAGRLLYTSRNLEICQSWTHAVLHIFTRCTSTPLFYPFRSTVLLSSFWTCRDHICRHSPTPYVPCFLSLRFQHAHCLLILIDLNVAISHFPLIISLGARQILTYKQRIILRALRDRIRVNDLFSRHEDHLLRSHRGRSPVLGTNYLKFEWFVPQTGLPF